MTDFRFCELQNRRLKCRSFVQIMMWSPKKKGSSPKFQRFLRSKIGDLQKKGLHRNFNGFCGRNLVISKKKKGLQASHAYFSMTFLWAHLELMGPLLGPLKPTAFLKPMGALLGLGVIVSPLSVALITIDLHLANFFSNQRLLKSN